MFRRKCLVCESVNLSEIINLGTQPFADSFIPTDRLSGADKVYPLVLDMCGDCYCIQSRTQTDPQERYEETDYSYTSSNSKFSRDHWDKYAKDVTSYVNLPESSKILEIGSNDGYLLKQFQNLGHNAVGVDVSKTMCDIALTNGSVVYNSLFTEKFAKGLDKYQLVVANNVFNHANDPIDFALGVKQVLAELGTFVFELPYWASGIENFRFDQIYHEHVTYYTVSHAVKLFKMVGLNVNHVEMVDYHGGSIRVFVSHQDYQDDTVSTFVDAEQQYRDPAFYKFFWMNTIKLIRSCFLANLYKRKAQHEKFVAVGAAAKGNTFLNFYGLDSTVIDFVTDSSPHKIGKYTPNTRIPIVADEALSGMGKVNVIILSWNISEQLKSNLLKINPEIVFFERKS